MVEVNNTVVNIFQAFAVVYVDMSLSDQRETLRMIYHFWYYNAVNINQKKIVVHDKVV